MDYSNYSLIKLIFFLILFNYSAEAICVPRNSKPSNTQVPSSSHTQVLTTIAEPPSETTFSTARPPTNSPRESPRINLINQAMKPEVFSAALDPSVKKICDSTDYSDVCLASLSTFLIPGKTDPVSVLESAIKAATEHAKQAMSQAMKLASAPNLPTRKANALSDCQYMFSDALDNLQSAMEALPSRDLATVNSMLSAVITDSQTCEDGFSGVSPLADFDATLRMMGSNCLAIASLIQ
ncbi:hypothetical protein FNV43_RR00997 [Rhamnella rubrinervis]|uniref:Pectinesterase inhibitor domain-containing protein n=1 Tax=Rhamnella rubrinervis TaxID=2594499 RepID=A0A8K0HNT9_9ROSA|nr:hypothetical protein FNV43_RR00997 [Rhamnella rubrinervis]